jgi:peptidoglycan biosynthesis protein MviN/MurJ (putative lipid II flippase)
MQTLKNSHMNKTIIISESYKKGFVISSSLNFFAKIIGFLNFTIIAYFFGTNSATDVYFFCLVIIGVVSGFLIALNSTILIPEAMRIKEQFSEEESQRFLSFFLFLYIAICIGLSLVVLVSPVRIFSLLSKFNIKTLNDNISIIYCSLPLLVLITTNALFTDILVSYKFFSISVISSLLNSVLSIVLIFAFHEKFYVLSILFGSLCANVIQILLNVWLLRKILHWSFRFMPIKIRRKTVKDSIVAQAGNFSTMLTGYIPAMLISKFPPGILSSISYAVKIPDFAAMLITNQFATVTGIKFNELYAQKKEIEIKQTFVDASSFLQFVLVPICVLGFFYSRDIIDILFGHGAFNKTSISLASQFMKIFFLVLPFAAHNTFVARLFMAAQKINRCYVYQIVMGLVMVFFVYGGIFLLGPSGYPLGVFVFYVVNSIAAITIMSRNFRFIPYEKTLLYTLKCLAINSPLIMFIIWINRIVVEHSPLFVAAVVISYSVFLLLLNHVFKLNVTIKKLIDTVSARIKAKGAAGRGT